MSTLITITRTAPLPTADLLVYGAKAAGSPSLVRDGYQPPQPSPEPDYAPASKWLDGSTPVSVRTPNAVLGLKVRIEAPDEAAHQVLVAKYRAALGQLDYTVAATLDGTGDLWRAYPGTLVLTNGNRTHTLPGLVVEYYTLTIPVHPIPGSP